MESNLLKRAGNSLNWSISFVFLFWIIRICESLSGYDLYFLGIYPREIPGSIGIITAPFIHVNYEHLIANTVPFFVLCILLFLFYPKKASLIFILLWITAGVFTWLIGRPAWHMGASIIIYDLAFFLFFGGIMSRKFLQILLSAGILVFYGGLIWGIFPSDNGVSWEGHLSGAVSGLIWAYKFRKIRTTP